MTAHRDLKRIIRNRQAKTGESYTAARAHVMRERAVVVGGDSNANQSAIPTYVEAAVLKVNQQSLRVRLLSEQAQITFRTSDLRGVVPGHLVTLPIDRRWTWRGDEYASGRIENPRIAVEKLGLVPLPLKGGELCNLRAASEPVRSPEPYAPMWRKLTAKPRAWFEMDPIAWGAFPGFEPDEDSTACDAAELAAAGDSEGAREFLMELLCTDLRCIDAHAHLGNLEIDATPQRAIVHYEIGIRIGELSLSAEFDGVLEWGPIHNRPFLRCLCGYGHCLWRLGRLSEAQEIFERILALNPSDNQGVRSFWDDVRHGRPWEEPDVPRGASGPDGPRTLH